MRKCCGNNWEEWGFDSIFEIECPVCGREVEFFKDEIRRTCPACRASVINGCQDYGCGQWCSSDSDHTRNFCSKFKRSKERYYAFGLAADWS